MEESTRRGDETTAVDQTEEENVTPVVDEGVPPRVLLYTSIVCFLAWVFSVYDYTLFGTLLPVIAGDFGWSPATSTAINTYVTVGTFVVSFAVGPMLDYLGRKPSLILTTAGAAVTSGLTALTPSAIYLVAIRAFSGLGYSEEVVNTVYLNEMLGTRKRRGFMYSFVQSGWPVGSLVAAGLAALLIPVIGWRGTFLVATFPAIVIVILGLKLRESPVFLTMKRVRELRREGRSEEAVEYGEARGLDMSHAERAGLRQVFAPDLRRHTVLLSLAWLLNWMGIQVFSVLGTTVLTQGKGVSFSSALVVLVIANAVGFCGYLVHGFIGDYIGRRRTILIGWLIGSVVMTAMLFGPDSSTVVIALYSAGLFFLVGPYAAMLFYMGESFPSRVRGVGSNVAHVMGPVGAIVGSALLTAYLGLGLDMTVAAFLTGVVGMFLSALCMLGTRDVSDPRRAEATADA